MRIGEVKNPYNPTLAETADQVKIPSPQIGDSMSSASPVKWLAIGSLFLLFCAALWKFLSGGGGSSRSSSSSQPQEEEKTFSSTQPQEETSHQTIDVSETRSLTKDQERALARYGHMKAWLRPTVKNSGLFYQKLQHVLNNVSDEEIQKHLDKSAFSKANSWERPDKTENLSPEMFFVLVRYVELALKKEPPTREEAEQTAATLQQQYEDLRRS